MKKILAGSRPRVGKQVGRFLGRMSSLRDGPYEVAGFPWAWKAEGQSHALL